MKRALVIALAGLLAACATEKKPEVDPFAVTRDSSCYTVDLFGQVPYKEPASAVPAEWRAFAGRWGGGKWDGHWCHDLYVLDVRADGTAQVIETYAPYAPWGKRATAFRRSAQIGPDGRLRMAYGRVQLEYWLEDGALKGLRLEDGAPRRIALERRPS